MRKNADMKFSFLDDLKLDQDVKQRLSLLLTSTVNGNEEVYLTPLAMNKETQSILEGWDSIFNANNGSINDVLNELEQSNRTKFGPRSIAKPWSERIDGVKSYFDKKENITTKNLGIHLPRSDKGRLRPLSLDNSVKFLKNDTNSGLPYYTRKSKIKARLIKDFTELLQRKDPCILFTRTQEGGKTRNVFGFPVVDTLNETRYYQPLLAYQKNKSWRSVLNSIDVLDSKISRMVNLASQGKHVLISIDFSGFDASIHPDLTRKAFEYVKFLYNENHHKEIDYICERFITIGLLSPDGVLEGEHGIPSGSTFTNEIGSIIQYLVADSSGLLTEEYFEIQGDDGAYVIGKDKVDEFVTHFTSLGLNVNVSKSYTSSDYVIYLQCLHHVDYKDETGLHRGIYPTYRALNRIVHQERWFDFEDYDLSGRDYYSIRSISILENCRYHPLFKEIVKYVVNLDKYKLQPSPDGLTKFIEMTEAKQGKDSSLFNQYGDKISGIRNFETYKLIKGML